MPNARSLFVAGTDTGVGKTRVAAGLIRSLRRRGIDAVGFKPVLCGPDRDDAEVLLAASLSPGVSPAAPAPGLDEVNPAWFRHPVAPLSAALLGETRPLDRRAILAAWEILSSRHEAVVIEGAGGWEVPLTATETFADLAREFAAPVLVVAANRLGVLNHTRLTVDAIGRAGLPCRGILLNETGPDDPDDAARRTNGAALRLLFPDLPLWHLAFGGELPPDLAAGPGLDSRLPGRSV